MATIEHRFPLIPWREPITVTISGRSKLGCRLCLATHGLRGAEFDTSPHLFLDHDDFAAHLAATHPET